MKRLFKISILFLCIFMILGCKKDEPIEPEPDKPVEKEDLSKKISIEDMGIFDGEYGERDGLLKVSNGNNKAVMANIYVTVYDSSKKATNTKNLYVRLGASSSAYVVIRQDFEEPKFYSYDYTVSVSDEELEDYLSIYRGMDVTYKDTGSKIEVNFKNNGSKLTTAYALVLFYSNNKVVAVSDATAYNMMPMNFQQVVVNYPMKTVDTKISFDRVYVTLNEVSTEL